MKPNMPRRALQRGFSLLTGFILAIIMFGTLAFFLAGQGINAGFGASYSNTSKVSSLLVSGGYIGTGFDAVMLAGAAPSTITFDTGNLGMFNPSSGGAAVQTLDPTLFGRTNTSDGYWIYRSNEIKLQGVGSALTGVSAVGDYTVLTSGLKLAICQQINTTLHGSSTVPNLTADDTALGITGVVSTSPTSTGHAVDLTAQGVAGWLDGCYQSATAGNYVYIHTLLAQ